MKEATLLHIIRDRRYVQMGYQISNIIGYKGYGGKIKANQTIRNNVIEELWEETGGKEELRRNPEEEGGMLIREEWLEPVGMIDFYNGPEEEIPFGNPSFRVYCFNCHRAYGRAIDTKEMIHHQLFDIFYLPLSKLVPGDDLFVPRLLQGVCLQGYVRRTSDFQHIIWGELEVCDPKTLRF